MNAQVCEGERRKVEERVSEGERDGEREIMKHNNYMYNHGYLVNP